MQAPWPDLKRHLVAILRGLRPDEATAIGLALVEAGITAVEVPLNSPDPYRSIEALRARLPESAVIGAGTVLTADQVRRVRESGGTLIVSPNADAEVIAAAAKAGMIVLPGVFTASECFAALKAGASGLKLFPASVLKPEGVKALGAVLPGDVPRFAVGGVGEGEIKAYREAGCLGFGTGSNLYKPGLSAEEVAANARRIVAAYDALPR